jgi:hypothetical protein
MRTIKILAAMAALIVGGISQAQTPEPAQQPGPNVQVILAAPQWSKDAKAFSLPAAFWNEHLTDWLDVALCGRPSNFLHETVLSLQSTRSIIQDAFFKIGYHPANQWAPNLADFVGIRGDPVLILVSFKQNGREQTYLLDELIAFQSWHVSIGPFGWLFLGTSDPLAGPTEQKMLQAARPAPADAILMDDPQIAMQFRGIQHQSQALLDHPLCFDDWIYPNIRYFRNEPLVSQAVFDSNGGVPAEISFRRVSETEFLQAAAQYWHDPAFATYVTAELPLAHQIDQARSALWKLTITDHQDWSSPDVQVYVAQIQSGYAALDAAWVDWDYQHAQFSAADELSAVQVQQEALSFKNHMDQKREQYQQLLLAAQAHAELTTFMAAQPPAKAANIDALSAKELSAQSQALLYANQQRLDYWTTQLKQTPSNDPRTFWLREIHAQYTLATDQGILGQTGLDCAKTLQSGDMTAIAKAKNKYVLMLLTVSLDSQQVALVEADFEISNAQEYAEPAEITALKAQRQKITDAIKTIQDQIKQLSTGPATAPATP